MYVRILPTQGCSIKAGDETNISCANPNNWGMIKIQWWWFNKMVYIDNLCIDAVKIITYQFE